MTWVRDLGVLMRCIPHLGRASTWRFAWRNVGRNGRRTTIVLTAVSVGLAGILLTMAVNYGMVVQMVETAIETELGHVQIHAPGYDEDPGLEARIGTEAGLSPGALAALPGLRAWAPRVRSEGLVYSPRASAGVSLVGVDPARESRITVLDDSVVAGRYLDGGRRQILVGELLADRLKVGVGDKVVVSVQDVAGDMTGEAYRVGASSARRRAPSTGSVFARLDGCSSSSGWTVRSPRWCSWPTTAPRWTPCGAGSRSASARPSRCARGRSCVPCSWR